MKFVQNPFIGRIFTTDLIEGFFFIIFICYNFSMKKNSGFIHIIVLIIIFVALAFYFGKDPVEIWEKIKPIFEYALDLFVKAIEFLIKMISKIWESVK